MKLHELDNITVKHQENVSKLCLSIPRERALEIINDYVEDGELEKDVVKALETVIER